MNDNEYLNNQKQIFQDLLEATIHEYSMIPGKDRGDITIGAHGTVLSFRNSTKGVLAGVIARSVLPEADDITPDRVISELYPLESLMKADVFGLHSFHNKECTILTYEGGERKDLYIYPDTAQDGLLIQLEWKGKEGMVTILKEDDVVDAMKTVLTKECDGNRLTWKPEVWFNGNRVKY